MILTTTETVPGQPILRILGIVRGNTVRTKHIGRNIVAGLRSIVGGEIPEYVEAISEARDQATQRMIDEARTLGADAIVNVRYATSEVMPGAAELLAYGTAVKLT